MTTNIPSRLLRAMPIRFPASTIESITLPEWPKNITDTTNERTHFRSFHDGTMHVLDTVRDMHSLLGCGSLPDIQDFIQDFKFKVYNGDVREWTGANKHHVTSFWMGAQLVLRKLEQSDFSDRVGKDGLHEWVEPLRRKYWEAYVDHMKKVGEAELEVEADWAPYLRPLGE
jgi:hypothetical protein